jgi:hypothetical protein
MLRVGLISKLEATRLVVAHHYMHRKPPLSYALGLFNEAGETKGVVTFGTPASHHMLIGACRTAPGNVIELNRLWVADDLPRNSESWFISRALALLPPKIILSYADTAAGHMGYVYRASNFHYAGWTDMDRKTPRFDYITPGMHTHATPSARASGGLPKGSGANRKCDTGLLLATAASARRLKRNAFGQKWTGNLTRHRLNISNTRCRAVCPNRISMEQSVALFLHRLLAIVAVATPIVFVYLEFLR